MSARVYISGALTGIANPTRTTAFYEAIGTLCKEMGLGAYVPHLNTDPIRNPGITPREVFQTDKHRVSTSDLLIAYVGMPSLGVGMEIAYAEEMGTPIILLYEKGQRISRFPRGIPTVISEIQFNDYEDALTQLKGVMEKWVGDDV